MFIYNMLINECDLLKGPVGDTPFYFFGHSLRSYPANNDIAAPRLNGCGDYQGYSVLKFSYGFMYDVTWMKRFLF